MLEKIRIGVSISRTQNLGNYNSIKIQIDLSADVSDLEADLQVWKDKIWQESLEELNRRLEQYVDRPKSGKGF